LQPKKHRLSIENPLQLLFWVLTKFNSLWLGRFYPFASIGRGVSFHFTSKVSRLRSPRVSLGSSISLKEFAWLNVATDDPTGEPTIVIEDNCHLGFGSIISAKNRIHLERDVLLGQVILLMDHNHAYEQFDVPIVDQGVTEGGTIRIGQGTWIGHGARVICARGELTIGRNCVIAADAVVTKSAPPYSILAGNPARVVKQYDPKQNAWVLGSVRSTQPDPSVEHA
jgi:acetyltransferase-like isoleucine patch superfamily enzyme